MRKEHMIRAEQELHAGMPISDAVAHIGREPDFRAKDISDDGMTFTSRWYHTGDSEGTNSVWIELSGSGSTVQRIVVRPNNDQPK